jgi:hypothetical protein
MTLHDYPSIVQAEIDRRYELAGVDRHGTRRSNRPRSDRADQANRADRADRPLGARRLVAYLARLLGGSARLRRPAPPLHRTPAHPSRGGAVHGIPGAAVCPRQL